MARYDGMDDLLARVGRHLENPAGESPGNHRVTPVALPAVDGYAIGVEDLVLLLRTAEHLREHLATECATGLNAAEREDLASLLRRVQSVLAACAGSLQEGIRAD